MKKVLSIAIYLLLFTTAINADFLKIEAGAGAWMQTPNTSMNYKDNLLTGKDESLGSEETNGYVWIYLKHPIPIIPNIRLEYVGISSKGTASGNFTFFPKNLPADTDSNIDMTQFDIVPYYNILDNTAWVTLDIGLDIKVIESTYSASPSADVMAGDVSSRYEETSSDILPLLYVRARLEIPSTSIGLETDVKYLTYDTTEVIEFRAKVDYTLEFVPVVQPAIELGYRVQTMNAVTDEDLVIDYDFAGVYAGIMLRF